MRAPAPMRNEMENGRSDRIQELKYWLNLKGKYPRLLEELEKASGEEGKIPKILRSEIQEKDLGWIIGMIGPMDNIS
ncbi:hypothetical protein KAU08_12720 [bacterium]|nr:hypothetical protein [bacterium]